MDSSTLPHEVCSMYGSWQTKYGLKLIPMSVCSHMYHDPFIDL